MSSHTYLLTYSVLNHPFSKSSSHLHTLVKHYHTHTHTRLTVLFPGLPGWAGTRKVKPIWILLKQETVRASGIRWAICKSAHRSRQITTPAPHHSVFLQAGCPSCHPTNSVKALKAKHYHILSNSTIYIHCITPISHNFTCFARWQALSGALRIS